MIDLNKYYISKKYVGPSGEYPAVGGFVPPATSGDAIKFLRGDGSWVNLQSQIDDLSVKSIAYAIALG